MHGEATSPQRQAFRAQRWIIAIAVGRLPGRDRRDLERSSAFARRGFWDIREL
jgi:hypothetical protein